MSPIHTIQPTFAGGELAPSLYSRVDLQKYGTGAKRLRNFIIHPHGGASNRAGTAYIAVTKYPSRKVKLIEFEFSVTQAYVLEVGHEYIRLHTHDGPLGVGTLSAWNVATAYLIGDMVSHLGVNYYCRAAHTGQTPASAPGYWYAMPASLVEIPTDYEEQDLAEIKVTQSADVLYIVHPDHPPMTLSRVGAVATTWPLERFDYKNGPFMVSNLDTAKTMTASAATGNITVTTNFDCFARTHVGAVYSTWSGTQAYALGDKVTSGGFGYACTQAHTNHAPPNATYWRELPAGPGALFRLRHSMAGEATQATAAAGATAISTPIRCGGTWRLISHGNWAGAFQIEKSEDNGTSWTLLRKFTAGWKTDGTGGDFNVNTFGTDEGQYQLRVNVTSVTNGTVVVDLSSDPYEHTGIFQVTGYSGPRQAWATVKVPLGYTQADSNPLHSAKAPTFDWAEGCWSHDAGFPSAIVFFQDRLAPGGSYSEPQTVWMSKTGQYDDFGRSQPLEDSDGISIPLPSRKLNGISNLVALAEIIALTGGSEWTVGPTQGGVVTPTSVDTRCQGYRGSSSVAPVVVGNRVVYVQPMGSVVRDLGYSNEVNGYNGEDLSVFANHLFGGYSITQIAYQQEPDSIVWCVRSDGKLLSLTYLREHEVLAWSWHDTQGQVESIAVIPSDGINEVWLAVKRGNTRFIERMAKRADPSNVKDQFFVDCGLSYNKPIAITGATAANPVVITAPSHGLANGDYVDISKVDGMESLNGKRFKVSAATANTFALLDGDTGASVDGSTYAAYVAGGEVRKAVKVLSGLSHLEGKSVAILADGNVLPPQVVSGGQITLPVAASVVHAGLGYVSDLQTLNVELKLQDGTTQDRFVKIPEVTIRFLNSRGGFIGPDEAHLDEIVQRSGEALGSPMELYSGDYVHTMAGGYSRGGSVFFRQADPLPVTILSIMPKVTPGG